MSSPWLHVMGETRQKELNYSVVACAEEDQSEVGRKGREGRGERKGEIKGERGERKGEEKKGKKFRKQTVQGSVRSQKGESSKRGGETLRASCLMLEIKVFRLPAFSLFSIFAS